MPILFFQGVIVTILSLVFVVAPNTSAAFAVLQDISIILYMGMYVCMFASAIKLRRSQPDVERPIRIRGLTVIACVGILAAAVRDRPGPDPACRLQRRTGRAVRRHRRGRRRRARHPAQFLHHFRRPEWASIDEAEVIAESEQ